MEICHFFVIFYDFVMKCCVQKYHLYFCGFGIKYGHPPFVVQKCTCYFCVLGPENTPPPTPYMSGTFVLAPPPPPPPDTRNKE